MERPPAAAKEIRNVDNWFYGNPGAISPKEADYIKKVGDLVSIVPKGETPLHRALERINGFQLSSLFEIHPVSNLKSDL